MCCLFYKVTDNSFLEFALVNIEYVRFVFVYSENPHEQCPYL